MKTPCVERAWPGRDTACSAPSTMLKDAALSSVRNVFGISGPEKSSLTSILPGVVKSGCGSPAHATVENATAKMAGRAIFIRDRRRAGDARRSRFNQAVQILLQVRVTVRASARAVGRVVQIQAVRLLPIIWNAVAVGVARCRAGLQLRPAADFRRRVDDFARTAADALDDTRVSRVASRQRRTGLGKQFG